MKNFKYILIALIFGSLLLVTSCQKDEEETPTPTSADPREKFKGDWTCQETGSGSQPLFYTVRIGLDSAIKDQIYILNFHYQGAATFVQAKVVANSFSLAQQQIVGSPSYTVLQGSGTWQNANTISVTYNINDGATTSTVTATLSK